MDTKNRLVYQAVGKVLEALTTNNAYKAAYYLSDKLVVRMSRKLYRGKLPSKISNEEVILVIGRPNYEQREFIKLCKKAGESFPVKKIQLKFPPKH